jgi:NitT/TauT family transport system ATP-binding protein
MTNSCQLWQSVCHPRRVFKLFLELDGVSLTYPNTKNPAIENVDLAVGRGEFVAVVGASGCGKSSMMKLVSGLHLATQGQVRLEGKPIVKPTGNVGMAFQNPTLLPWRNVLDNLLLPLEVVRKKDFRRQKGEFIAEARRLLKLVNLQDVETKFPWQLSGGMQQRVSLCRALIHRPEILLLDEPFAALDAFTREALWVAMQDLWAATKCTVVLVTHDLREAVFLADTIHLMGGRPGRVITSRHNPLSRPRTLEDTYTQPYIAEVHDLRAAIGEVRDVVV